MIIITALGWAMALLFLFLWRFERILKLEWQKSNFETLKLLKAKISAIKSDPNCPRGEAYIITGNDWK